MVLRRRPHSGLAASAAHNESFRAGRRWRAWMRPWRRALRPRRRRPRGPDQAPMAFNVCRRWRRFRGPYNPFHRVQVSMSTVRDIILQYMDDECHREGFKEQQVTVPCNIQYAGRCLDCATPRLEQRHLSIPAFRAGRSRAARPCLLRY